MYPQYSIIASKIENKTIPIYAKQNLKYIKTTK